MSGSILVGPPTRTRAKAICQPLPVTVFVTAILAFFLGLFIGGLLGGIYGLSDGVSGDHSLLQHIPRRGRALLAGASQRRILSQSSTLAPSLAPSPLPAPSPPPSPVPIFPVAPRHRGRNLVICLAEGVEYNGAAGVRWLARFGGSFRRFNEVDDVVFLTMGVNPSIAPLLESVRLTPLLFGNETSPWSEMEVATRRWYLIRMFLQQHAQDYADGWVLAIDARDTFFQRDPFSFPRAPVDEENGLYVFLEGQGEFIRDSDWNLGVLSSCYTEAELEPITGNPVSCSGTVMGTYSAMLTYLQLMEKEILATSNNPKCMATGGRDQGFHNVILYRGDLARATNVVAFDNPTGALVRTVRSNEYFIDRLGRVLTDRGEVAYIVHQWDRSALIFSIIDHTLFPTVDEGIVLPPLYPGLRRDRIQLEQDVLERGDRQVVAIREHQTNNSDALLIHRAAPTSAAEAIARAYRVENEMRVEAARRALESDAAAIAADEAKRRPMEPALVINPSSRSAPANAQE